MGLADFFSNFKGNPGWHQKFQEASPLLMAFGQQLQTPRHMRDPQALQAGVAQVQQARAQRAQQEQQQAQREAISRGLSGLEQSGKIPAGLAEVMATMDPEKALPSLVDLMQPKDPTRYNMGSALVDAYGNEIYRAPESPRYETIGNELIRVSPGGVESLYKGEDKPRNLPSGVEVAQYLYPGDLDAQRKYLEEAGRDINVNTGPQQSAFDDAVGKQMASKYTSYIEGAEQAQGALNNIQETRTLLMDPNLYTGVGAEQLLTLKKAAQAMGVDVSGVESGEALLARTSDQALEGAAKLPGVASESDMALILKGTTGISDTREGALLKLNIAERMAQQQIRIAEAAQDYVAQNGVLDQNWVREYSRLSQEFRAEVMQQIANDPTHPAGPALQRVRQLQAEGLSPDEIRKKLKAEGLLP